MTWFPRPFGADDLRLLGPTPAVLSLEEHCRYLMDPEAEEWRHKVGVAGPVEGSAKATTRLLLSNEWVYKTRTDLASSDPETPLLLAQTALELQLNTNIWHPARCWLLMVAEGSYWPVSATPRLITLRAVRLEAEQAEAWLNMFRLAADAYENSGQVLDMNPSNFGYLWGLPEKLYYLDDETYPCPQPLSLATSLKIWMTGLEHPLPDPWAHEASELLRRLLPSQQDQHQLANALDHWQAAALCQRLRWFPIAGARARRDDIEPPRSISSQPITLSPDEPQEQVLPPPASAGNMQEAAWIGGLVCVFSDIHANLPAFEAMLAHARWHRPDAWVFLGDVVGYGPWPLACLQLLQSLNNLHVVQGNHDWMAGTGEFPRHANERIRSNIEWTRGQLNNEHCNWLTQMPHRVECQRTWFIHGSLLHNDYRFGYIYEQTWMENLQRLAELDLSMAWYGHTHLAMAYCRTSTGLSQRLGPFRFLANKPLMLVNPGSVGQPRDGDNRAAYALWNTETHWLSFQRLPYNYRQTQQEMKRLGLADYYAQRLEQGR